MSSWSENRTKAEGWSKDVKNHKITQINGVLTMLSKDDDLHDDLKLPIVNAAIKHWTNQVRLPPEESAKFQEHRRVMYVLQRFQILQSVCTEACIPVPLDHLLGKLPKLSDEIIAKFFGVEFLSNASVKTQIDAPKVEPTKTTQQKKTTSTKKVENTTNTNTNSTAGKDISSSSASVDQKASVYTPVTTAENRLDLSRNTTEQVVMAINGIAILVAVLIYIARESGLFKL